jgi:assimilatory nitrate reductase catalytic subunit
MRIVPGDRTSEFSTASWDEALSFVVSKITELRAADGPDAIGCFGGGGLTNEKAYAFGKFARVALRTSMIDYNDVSVCPRPRRRRIERSELTADCRSH